MIRTIVKDFWIDPENPPINDFNQFSFGYNNRGKDYRYSVKVNPAIKNSQFALHDIFWKIRDSKKGSYLPWEFIPQSIKSKLIITNLDDPQTSFLPDLLDKVAYRLDVLNKLLRWS